MTKPVNNQDAHVACKDPKRDTELYGGQAVLEGVLMKGRNRAVVACRNYKGEIVSKILMDDPEGKAAQGARRIPFLRGMFILWDSLTLGMSALNYSADVAMEAEKAGSEPGDGNDEGSFEALSDEVNQG